MSSPEPFGDRAVTTAVTTTWFRLPQADREGRRLWFAIINDDELGEIDHEADNPQGVWCCDLHRAAYDAERAERFRALRPLPLDDLEVRE